MVRKYQAEIECGFIEIAGYVYKLCRKIWVESPASSVNIDVHHHIFV